ncbi:MAG TPA: hypothetical protein VL225_08310 [Vicinamibacterales bacterium]|nr:hypothetical protein [Vicinamibacterales bacterium]
MKRACPLCSARKPKRACPALGRDICPVCCGTKRLTEIACPPDCGYLSASRAHPPAVALRQHERDMGFLLPRIGDLSEAQYRLFLFAAAIALRHSQQATPAPLDADVADAAASVAATLETAHKGIIYEHRAPSMPAQRLGAEISQALGEAAGRAGADAARLERDAATALRRLEDAARAARTDVPDETRPESSWLALSDRLMQPQAPASAPEPPDSKLVL